MDNNSEKKAFRYGFLSGILLSLIVQIATYAVYAYTLYIDRHTPPSHGIYIHSFRYFGFPFPIFNASDYSPVGSFDPVGIIGNILVTLIFSFILGLIFKFIWSKITARKLT